MKTDRAQTPKVPGKREVGGRRPVPGGWAPPRPPRGGRRCRQDAWELGPGGGSVLTHAPKTWAPTEAGPAPAPRARGPGSGSYLGPSDGGAGATGTSVGLSLGWASGRRLPRWVGTTTERGRCSESVQGAERHVFVPRGRPGPPVGLLTGDGAAPFNPCRAPGAVFDAADTMINVAVRLKPP